MREAILLESQARAANFVDGSEQALMGFQFRSCPQRMLCNSRSCQKSL